MRENGNGNRFSDGSADCLFALRNYERKVENAKECRRRLEPHGLTKAKGEKMNCYREITDEEKTAIEGAEKQLLP
jgi:hypothetical protein